MYKNNPSTNAAKITLILAIVLSFINFSANAQEIVGKISGELTVSQGSLAFVLPLDVPSGIHGNSPELSINYNPKGLSGVLGTGFSFSAASTISRCTPNKEKDGFESGIQLDSTASFCHNGERLINVSSNTERGFFSYYNNNAKYQAIGGNALHTPEMWKVFSPEGMTYSFIRHGNLDSDLHAVWFLDTEEDTFGNVTQYHYSDELSPVLERITYSGYQIDFEYTDRKSKLTQYQNGQLIVADQLLRVINVSVNQQGASLGNSLDMFSYRLDYDDVKDAGGTALDVDRLGSVTRCYSEENCLKPLVFSYEQIPDPNWSVVDDFNTDITAVVDREDYYFSTPPSKIPLEERPSFSTGDINGDGVGDFCFYKVGTGIQCTTYTGNLNNTMSINGATIPQPFTNLENWAGDLGYNADELDEYDDFKPHDHKAYSALRLLDLNADGKADFCITDDQGVRCGLSDGSRFSNIKYWNTELNNTAAQPNIGFIDNDEYLDICGLNKSEKYQCFTGNGSNFFSNYRTFNDVKYYEKIEWDLQECVIFGRSCEIRLTRQKAENALPPASWHDIDGDFDQDLCWASLTHKAYVCKYAETDPQTGDISYSSPQKLFALDFSKRLPSPPALPLIKSRHKDFEENIKEQVTDITKNLSLGFRFANLNGDSMLDVCYVERGKNSDDEWVHSTLKCLVNTGKLNETTGFGDSETFISSGHSVDFISILPPSFDENFIGGALASINMVDRNLNGLSDLCIIVNNEEYCALNTGTSFSSFQNTLYINADIDVDSQDISYYTNFVKRMLGRNTVHYFQVARAGYGNLLNIGDINDDGSPELCYRSIWGITCSSKNGFGPVAKLKSITDSYGLTTAVEYGNIHHNDLYDDFEGVPPQGFKEIVPNMEVVSSIRTDTAVHLKSDEAVVYSNAVNYRYGGYLVNSKEERSGFTSNSIIRQDRNLITRIKNYANLDLFGEEKSSTQYLMSGNALITLKKRENHKRLYELANGTRRVLLDKTIETQNDLNGALVSILTTENTQYDHYAFPREVKVTKSLIDQPNLITRTSTNYEHETQKKWILGLVDEQTVKHEFDGEVITRKVDFEYIDGVLYKEIIQPESPNTITHIFSNRDTYGNIQTTQSLGNAYAKEEDGIQKRTTEKTFDSQGRVLTTTNDMGIITYTYNDYCGGLESEKGITGLKTQTQYNAFCEKQSVTNLYDDNSTRWDVEWATAEDQSFDKKASPYDYVNAPVYKVTETHASGVESTTYYDAQGRDIRTRTTGFANKGKQRDVYTNRVYDRYGNKTAETLPYYDVIGQPGTHSLSWITMTYDAFNRPRQQTSMGPDNTPLAITYHYTSTTSTQSYSDYYKTTTNGVHGKPILINENGIEIAYNYNPIGDLASTTQSGLVSTIHYDSRGFKRSMSDPAMGDWRYTYNAFGELVEQIDANQNITTFVYDTLGRKKQRTNAEGHTYWDYYITGNGKGQLEKEHGAALIAEKNWDYNSLGQVETETLNIAAQGGLAAESLTTQYHYDNYSRLDYTIHPNDTKIYQDYDNLGLLKSVSMSAQDFQDFNFDKLQSEREKLITEFNHLQVLEAEALALAEAHHRQYVEHEAQRQHFVSQLAKVTGIVKDLDAAAEAHHKLAGQYFTLIQDYETQLAIQKTDLPSGKSLGWLIERQFKFKHVKNSRMTFETSYCSSYHGWGPTKYCAKRRNYSFSLPVTLDLGDEDIQTITLSKEDGTLGEIYGRAIARIDELKDYEDHLYDLARDSKNAQGEIDTSTGVRNMTASQAKEELVPLLSDKKALLNKLESFIRKEEGQLCPARYSFWSGPIKAIRCQGWKHIISNIDAGVSDWYLTGAERAPVFKYPSGYVGYRNDYGHAEVGYLTRAELQSFLFSSLIDQRDNSYSTYINHYLYLPFEFTCVSVKNSFLDQHSRKREDELCWGKIYRVAAQRARAKSRPFTREDEYETRQLIDSKLFERNTGIAISTLWRKVAELDEEIALYQPIVDADFAKDELGYRITSTSQGLIPIISNGITIFVPGTVIHGEHFRQELTLNNADNYFIDKRDHFAEEAEKFIALRDQVNTEFNEGTGLRMAILAARRSQLDDILGKSNNVGDELEELTDIQVTPNQKLKLWEASMRTPQGDLQSEIFGNGLYTERKINSANNMLEGITTKTVSENGHTLRDLSYTFDARGRIETKIDTSSTGNQTEETFSYEASASGRLESWHFTQKLSMPHFSGSLVKTNTTCQNYGYDASGNMLTKGNWRMDYDAQASNRLLSRSVRPAEETCDTSNHQQASNTETIDASSFGYTYDNNGNMKTGDGRSYQWYSFNKAKSISHDGKQVEFAYDSGHKRLRKISNNEVRYYVNPNYEKVIRGTGDQQRITHRFTIWSGNDAVATYEKTEKTQAEIDAEIEAQAMQAKLSDSADTEDATVFNDTLRVAETADRVAYIHRDIIGNGELVTDSKMNVITRRYYSPYGELVDTLLDEDMYQVTIIDSEGIHQIHSHEEEWVSSNEDNIAESVYSELDVTKIDLLMSEIRLGQAINDTSGLRGFTSHEAIEEIGLINMNARLYDPVIGRFMSADTMVPDASNPLDFNRYAYLRGNPVNARDPSGHFLVLAAALSFFVVAHAGDNENLQVLSTVLLSAALMNPSTSIFSSSFSSSAANAAFMSGATSLTMSFLQTGKIGKKDLQNAGIAALSGAAAGYMHTSSGALRIKDFGQRMAYHMATQGVVADLRGDTFISGAVSGLMSTVAGQMNLTDNAVGSALLGGLTAKATGGQFLNGALQAASVHLFNDAAKGVAQKARGCSGQMCRPKPTEPREMVSSLTAGAGVPFPIPIDGKLYSFQISLTVGMEEGAFGGRPIFDLDLEATTQAGLLFATAEWHEFLGTYEQYDSAINLSGYWGLGGGALIGPDGTGGVSMGVGFGGKWMNKIPYAGKYLDLMRNKGGSASVDTGL